MKKKAMLSQPMAGKTEKEIIETRNRAIAELERRGYEVVNTLFTDDWYSHEKMAERGVVQIPLCFLAKSLENMSPAMPLISAPAGRMLEAVELNTTQRLITGLR